MKKLRYFQPFHHSTQDEMKHVEYQQVIILTVARPISHILF